MKARLTVIAILAAIGALLAPTAADAAPIIPPSAPAHANCWVGHTRPAEILGEQAIGEANLSCENGFERPGVPRLDQTVTGMEIIAVLQSSSDGGNSWHPRGDARRAERKSAGPLNVHLDAFCLGSHQTLWRVHVTEAVATLHGGVQHRFTEVPGLSAELSCG